MVDKDLFLHDLSIVAIMKCEGPYLKEWLDYHLLAGVDHFYLYDNESPDNQAEVAKPYVEAGLVDYMPAPGKAMQMFVYHDAVKKFRFLSRYFAVIDGDEFIYPKSRGGGVVEVVDEILSHDPNAAGLSMNMIHFGSNGQEKADYSRGVLERFTRRAPKDWAFSLYSLPIPVGGNPHVKTIFNPRMVSTVGAHNATFFEQKYSVNENGKIVSSFYSSPVADEKIRVNHYHTKSREEYEKKRQRGKADRPNSPYPIDFFDHSEEFDDSILHYRAERAKTFRPPDLAHADERLLNALTANLSPTLVPTTPPQFYAGKMETFLTCRAVADYLKTRLTDAAPATFFEEASLKAIIRTLVSGGMSLADARLFLRELPKLLSLPYPVVKDLRSAALNIIPQVMNVMHLNNMWKDFVELEYTNDLLKLI